MFKSWIDPYETQEDLVVYKGRALYSTMIGVMAASPIWGAALAWAMI